MVPRRDYEDFGKYINESHASRKELLTGGIAMVAQMPRGAQTSMNVHAPTLDILSHKSTTQNFFKTKSRQFS